MGKSLVLILCIFLFTEASSNEPIVAYKDSSGWKVLNKKGKEIFWNSQIEDILSYSEGLFLTSILDGYKKKILVLDDEGNVVFEHNYNLVKPFHSGRAIVHRFKDPSGYNYKLGMIDKSGRLLLDTIYDDLSDVSEGKIYYKMGNERGYLDTNGKLLFRINESSGKSFSEGLAIVTQDLMMGAIDSVGKMRIPLKYDELYSFSEGRAKFNKFTLYGYIDSEGNEVIPYKFELARDFHDGFAFVGRLYPEEGIRWAIIDEMGKKTKEYSYSIVNDFSEGLASVVEDSTYGFIHGYGEYVIPSQFKFASSFVDDIAMTENIDGSVRFIDKSGKEILMLPTYEKVIDLRTGHIVIK